MSEVIHYRVVLRQAVVAALAGVLLWVVNRSVPLGIGHLLPPIDNVEGRVYWLLAGGLVLLLMLTSGGHIFSRAWKSVTGLKLNQDTLIALGTGIAWVYSMVIIIFPEWVPALNRHPYFDVVLLIIALRNIGLVMEMRTVGMSSQGIEGFPGGARSRPDIALLVDKMATALLPAVIIISALSFLLWYSLAPTAGHLSMAFVTSMSVLFVASPAALTLAASIPLTLGINKAAELGAQVRSGAVLQQLGKLTTVVLAKTGTVTEGQHGVVEVIPADGFSEDEVLTYALSAESSSQHLLARAIVEYARSKGQRKKLVSAYQRVPGQGIEAVVEGEVVRVGNTRLMMEKGIDGGWLGRKAAELSQLGQTPMFISVDKEIAGLISVSNTLRSDSVAAIQRMQQAGLKVVLLSGDNAITSDVIAKQLGVDEVIADVLPVEKLAELEKLQKRGEVVAMVGDGNSDTEMLACADVAIDFAVDGTNEDLDIALTRDSLYGVVDTIELSRAVLGNIKQGLSAALVYNSLAIPVAAGILVPFLGSDGVVRPLTAGIGMILSHWVVMANAWRLQSFSPRQR